jgi:hypothetical protein
MILQKLGGYLLLAAAALCSPAVRAGVIYDESVSGDLSNSGPTPTLLTVSPGSNQLFGTTGKTNIVIDRDYFTFTVPDGMELSGLTVLPGTQTLGTLGESFIGIEEGPEVTVSTGASNAAGLLGWYHYGADDIDTDILPLMGTAGMGSTGFTPPLPADTYSFWVQEASTGSVNYGLDFEISSAPEPGSWVLLLAGLAVLLGNSVTGYGHPRKDLIRPFSTLLGRDWPQE